MLHRYLFLGVFIFSLSIAPFIWYKTSEDYLSFASQKKISQYRAELLQVQSYRDNLKHLDISFRDFLRHYSIQTGVSVKSFMDFFDYGTTYLRSILQFHLQLSVLKSQIPVSSPLIFYTDSNSPFGVRLDPFNHQESFHTGIDLDAQEGDLVLAAADGEVLPSDKEPAYGLNVVVKHSYGFLTLYGHLRSLQAGIKPGKNIKRGDIIGHIGHTGRSRGPHLHYEIRMNNLLLDPKDFLEWGKNLYSG